MVDILRSTQTLSMFSAPQFGQVIPRRPMTAYQARERPIRDYDDLYDDIAPRESPPAYIESCKPSVPVTYTFSQISSNSMLVIPPPNVPDTRPKYHISVAHNCFAPMSYITTIRRGSSDNGVHVAEFEMGMSSTHNATVCIRGREMSLSRVITKDRTGVGKWKARWTWKGADCPFFWDCKQSDKYICYGTKHGTKPIAEFAPKTEYCTPRRPAQTAALKIFPAGHDFFDSILLSVLIIERHRLTPWIQ